MLEFYSPWDPGVFEKGQNFSKWKGMPPPLRKFLAFLKAPIDAKWCKILNMTELVLKV